VFKGHDKGRKVREGTSVLDFRSKDLQTCRFGVVHSSPPSGIVSASFCLVGAGRYLPWPRASPSQPRNLPSISTLPALSTRLPPSSIPFRLRHFLFALASTFCRRLFRFHGRGYVVRQRHAAGATPSATATAARRVTDVFDARSARRQHLDIDTGWWSEFSKVSRCSGPNLLLKC
jgi:hypothetical protein